MPEHCGWISLRSVTKGFTARLAVGLTVCERTTAAVVYTTARLDRHAMTQLIQILFAAQVRDWFEWHVESFNL